MSKSKSPKSWAFKYMTIGIFGLRDDRLNWQTFNRVYLVMKE